MVDWWINDVCFPPYLADVPIFLVDVLLSDSFEEEPSARGREVRCLQVAESLVQDGCMVHLLTC